MSVCWLLAVVFMECSRHPIIIMVTFIPKYIIHTLSDDLRAIGPFKDRPDQYKTGQPSLKLSELIDLITGQQFL